jgi:DNA-binding transcriptional ArsR family regulator
MTDNKDYRLRLDRGSPDVRKRFEVVSRPESVFDVMLALWSAFGDEKMSKEQEIGRKFFETFRKEIPTDTLAEIERIGVDEGSMWATLLTFVASRAPVGDDESVLTWLETTDEDIAGAILSEMAWSADEAELAAAIDSRDPAALASVMPAVKEHARSCVATALQVPVGEIGPATAKILRTVKDTSYGSSAETWRRAIAASAESTRVLSATLDPHELIEQVTNGIAYQIPLGTRQLVLVPTVTLRPWTLITDFGDSIVVAYAVADEHMDRDPDAAPGWLVRFHKALGDDKRLRILREIAGGGATTLADLTEVLGLAKSTVFHHMGILRAAGLVRVVFEQGDDGTNTYQLRFETFADAEAQLQKYLEVIITHEGTRS